ncbi:hypothetical protein V8E36_002873 [Tilletia maclaganii]
MSFKKDEETGVGLGQDKSSVIQEARVFNETPISPRRCRILLTKLLYLLYGGETFSRQEGTNLFFGATKLFQHKDAALRQMTYLSIKELTPISDDTIMIIASILKDMQPNTEVIYRPNAIRALTRVVDPSMVQGLERFFKTAIVDKNSFISSAALVSSYHLNIGSRDVVKRWANEAQEAINPKVSSSPFGGNNGGSGFGGAGGYLGFAASAAGYGSSSAQQGAHTIPSTSFMTQYHALGLLYLIRQGDRMAISKLIQQLGTGGGSSSKTASALRSPYALCMLVRFAARLAEEDPNMRAPMTALLEDWLRHKSDMVNYEAARALCELRGITTNELSRPVGVLQLFLSSPKPTLKFASIRTLAKLAHTHPAAVQACNVDMENLITDPNRSIATYAITTLLKTGNEASVDRLMKQISGFMGEISDEFKVIVVDAIRSLCLKFPSKQVVMLGFLSSVLRDEGGYEFKRAVVEAIFDMVRFIGECKETALAHLCEFIEDCEFTKLSVRILHLLGVEGPKMAQPHKYIRYIYNRVILENAIVRAAAVASLAKFGIEDKSLNARIKVLLERCLDDVDDEVRDRAAMYLRILREDKLANRLLRDDETYQLRALEASLSSYVAEPAQASAPFDASAVPKISREEAEREALRAKSEATANVAMAADNSKSVLAGGSGSGGIGAGPSSGPGFNGDLLGGGGGSNGGAGSGAERYAEQLKAVPQLASYGALLKSSETPVELTERETEYVVTAVKHVFAEHIVFQYNVSNTVPDTVLENVAVVVGGAADVGLQEDFIITIDALSASNPSGVVYVSFTRTEGPASFPIGTLQNTLRFVSKEVDPASGEPEEEGYDDEYQTEDLELGVADYVAPRYANFTQEWDKLGKEGKPEATETFALTALDSLKTACSTLVDLLGMQPLGGTELPMSASVHTLQLAGTVATGSSSGKGGVAVLARCRMTFEEGEGVNMELAVRAEDAAAVELIIGAIA